MTHPLQWKKIPVLNDGFICLVDHMGDDSSIVRAARVSYGNDNRTQCKSLSICKDGYNIKYVNDKQTYICTECKTEYDESWKPIFQSKDRQLIRYLMAHSHTTPFEMVEIKFLVRVPMDCWRQWIRHRTANVNEYSTRYTEAIDSQQTTPPGEWRLQATDNKQGSSGYLEEWPEGVEAEYHQNCEQMLGAPNYDKGPGTFLSYMENNLHNYNKKVYQERLALGIAKEQARKDLPLSTYTEAYWKCDLHNIFNFLRLRMDSHAQLEIRSYANAMYEIVKGICPVACEAFEDYVLHAKKFSRMEMEVLRNCLGVYDSKLGTIIHNENTAEQFDKPSSMTEREWKEFLGKLNG